MRLHQVPTDINTRHYLANCSVPIGTPCNSASALAGAAIVYLNVVLVIAVLLMTITIA